MQKHRTRTNRKSKRFENFNARLSDVCRNRIETLVEGLPEGQFSTDYLRSSYRSKYCGPGTATPAERRQAAIAGWRQSEENNRLTNERLRGMDRGFNILPRITFYRFLSVAQHFVSSVLGDLSDEIVIGGFSGGASTSRPRTSSLPAMKFYGEADVTEDAAQYLGVIHRLSELYRQYDFGYFTREVPGAELFTVPKKSDVDRCACKEPDINMFLQKGVGNHIRRRLRVHGINLNDQSINRRLAHRASVEDNLATIDLSAASDSVTCAAVQALLPTEWFLYLNDIRSRSVSVDGTFVQTYMFSSMGNGFTFELESLIFWALCKATFYLTGVRGIVSVYGDDLIVPCEGYDDLTYVLSVFGFTVNPDKSFHSGPFRESCGGHYHLGNDVTPFYLRRPPERLTDLIRVANQLRLWALVDPGRQYELPMLYSLWDELRRMVPEDLRGGCDLSVDTQLVDCSVPKYVLSRVRSSQDSPPVGAYLHWHTTHRNRTSEAIVGHDHAQTNNLCRKRRAKPGAVTDRLCFREEI